MTAFQPNEVVDLTIQGATVVEPRSPQDTSLTLRYYQVNPGQWATIELDHAEAPNVTITRVAPADWPVLAGDVWVEKNGKRWFAYQRRHGATGEVWLCSETREDARPEDLLRVTRLTLQSRKAGAPS